MNIYFYVILITLLIGFILDLISDYLNLKKLGEPLPDEFKDVYSPERYLKSQEYTKVRTKFGFITSTLSLIAMLFFWFSGGFNYLDLLISQYSDNLIIRGLLYIGVLAFAGSILSLPFSIYSTFVIEEKFGFNKTTPKTFILDLIKSFLLSLALGAPILALILYIIDTAGEYAWLYGWGAVTLFSLIVQYIAPTYIMPIFNKFKPLEDGDLRNAILQYAEKVKFPLKNVFIMDGSRRSTKANAFFTGFGKNKRIALFDTLLEKHSIEEIITIIAHEVGHFKKKHILIGSVIGFIHTGILFFLLSLFLGQKELYDAFFMQNQPIYAGLIFFGMLYSPIESLLSIALNLLSRKNEYEADEFAVKTTRDKESMIKTLKNLSETNLSNLTPHPFYVFLNYSHPTALQRIERIRKISLNSS
jgi:STE24 endopeptidase